MNYVVKRECTKDYLKLHIVKKQASRTLFFKIGSGRLSKRCLMYVPALGLIALSVSSKLLIENML